MKLECPPSLPSVAEEPSPDSDLDVHVPPPVPPPTPWCLSDSTPSSAPTPHRFDVSSQSWRTRMGLAPVDPPSPPDAELPPLSTSRPDFFAPNAQSQTRQRFADAHVERSFTDRLSDDARWNGGNNFDPPPPPPLHPPKRSPAWDSFDRDGYDYQPSREGVIARRRHPPAGHGPTWFQFQVDPYQQINIDTSTGTIAPWYSPRANFGTILNHPVPLNLPHIDKEFFLA